jgi:hypothetical protein
MPFGPVINFLLAQKKNLGQPKAGHHFRHCLTVQINSNGLLGTGVQLKLRKHPNAYIAIK